MNFPQRAAAVNNHGIASMMSGDARNPQNTGIAKGVKKGIKKASLFFVVFTAFFFVVMTALPVCRGQQRPAAPRPKDSAEPAPKTDKKEMPEFRTLFRLPEEMPFPKGGAGNPKTITLIGNPLTEGLYVTRTLIPKGKQIIPHSHSDSRTVVVLSGTYYYGIGEEFDEKRLTALPPGSFFVEPAGVPHFTWAKNEDVIVQTTAVGPSGTQIVPAKPVPKPTPNPTSNPIPNPAAKPSPQTIPPMR